MPVFHLKEAPFGSQADEVLSLGKGGGYPQKVDGMKCLGSMNRRRKELFLFRIDDSIYDF